MEAMILGVTFCGTLATAYAIQRAVLGLCLKAIDRNRG